VSDVPALTVTVAPLEAEPPAPVQVAEYVVVTVGETTVEPEVPVPVKFVNVHEVALVEDHVTVDDWPDVIEVGFAVTETVGSGVALWVVALAAADGALVLPAASYAATVKEYAVFAVRPVFEKLVVFIVPTWVPLR
jgi:hypothetical protein